MITVALPQPQGLQFVPWGSLAAEQLAEFGILAPVSEDTWKEWVYTLLMIPELDFIPDPTAFTDWREWASRVLETL